MNKVTVKRDSFKIIVEEKEATLNELLDGFENALQGLGFSWKGQLFKDE